MKCHFLYLYLLCFTSLYYAQTLDSVWFPPSNISYCRNNHVDVTSVSRYFDAINSTYQLKMNGTSTLLPSQPNAPGISSPVYWSILKVRFGFHTISAPVSLFCAEDANNCTIYDDLTFEKSLYVPEIPTFPLSDIMSEYSVVGIENASLFCVQVAPVGYQHPVWRKLFIFLPIAITLLAAIVSFVVSVIKFENNERYELLLFTSNHVTLPGILRLRTPGLYDLMFYTQFIVILGQFNLDYPRFYPLFTSNFAWSFLLWQTEWLHPLISRLFPSSIRQEYDLINQNIPGLSLYKRQLDTHDSNNVVIEGTGMADFSSALGIDINALFITMTIYLALILGCCLVLSIITAFVLNMLGKLDSLDNHKDKVKRIKDFFLGILIRVLSLFYVPIMTISFYQLMIPSHWYITLVAALLLVIPFLSYGFIALKLLHIKPSSFMFTEMNLLLKFGSLYNLFTDNQFHFFILAIFHQTMIAIMIGLFHASGIAQIIVILLVELLLFFFICFKFPYIHGPTNYQQMIYSAIRFILVSLNIPYLPQIRTSVMNKQYVAYAQLALHSICYILFLLLLTRNMTIILSGLRDDEIEDNGKPSVRNAFWKNNNTHRNQNDSTSGFMSGTTVGKSQANSVNPMNAIRISQQGLYMEQVELLPTGNEEPNVHDRHTPDQNRYSNNNISGSNYSLESSANEAQKKPHPYGHAGMDESINRISFRSSYPIDDIAASSSQSLLPQNEQSTSRSQHHQRMIASTSAAPL